MNNLNYASLDASKKLHDAGIVLKTEAYWIRVANSPMMLVDNRHGADEYYPAPSMAEVWRELPDGKELAENKGCTYASIEYGEGKYKEFSSMDNPTDSLIDLLIWVKEQNRERIVKKLIDHADKLKW